MFPKLQDFTLTYSKTGSSEIFYRQKSFTIRAGPFEKYTYRDNGITFEEWDLSAKIELQLNNDTEYAQLCTGDKTIEIMLSEYFNIIESLIKMSCSLIGRITKQVLARHANPGKSVDNTICLAYKEDQKISKRSLMNLKSMQPIIVTISNKMQGENLGFAYFISLNHPLILDIEEVPISQT